MSKDPVVICTDGRCEPDPGGVATIGWVAKQGDKEIHSHNAFVCSGPVACSAIAEYTAVISALEWLLGSTYKDQEVVIRTDAQQTPLAGGQAMFIGDIGRDGRCLRRRE